MKTINLIIIIKNYYLRKMIRVLEKIYFSENKALHLVIQYLNACNRESLNFVYCCENVVLIFLTLKLIGEYVMFLSFCFNILLTVFKCILVLKNPLYLR